MKDRSVLTSPELLAGALSGLLLSLASPPTVAPFLGYVALVPVLLLLFHPQRFREAKPLRLKVLIFSFGIVRHMVQLHWLLILDDAASFKFRWLLPLMLLLLAIYLALWDGLVFVASNWLRKRHGAQAIWWFPAVWVAVEWLRGWGEMGFPWMRLAMSQLDYVPMLQLAGIFGELGVSLLVCWINVLFALTWLAYRREFPGIGRAVLFRWWAPVTLCLVFGGSLVYGISTVRQLEDVGGRGEGLTVGIIQGNVDLSDKFDPARRDSTFIPYTLLSQQAVGEGARLLVWPETTIPFDITRSADYMPRLQRLTIEEGAYLFTGFPERQVGEDGYLLGYNSSFLMDDSGVVRSRYRKMHLLPFGERMPGQGILPILGKLDFGQAEWTPGAERTILDVDGYRFSNLICFESIFAGPARDAVDKGAEFLVNMSNDGWFGDTLGPHQHGLLAAMRAAENRVPLIRCANNGICFFALPSGRVVQKTDLFERTQIVRTIYPNPRPSAYTRWGDLPLAALLLFSCGILYFIGRRSV